jgi:hypothetical protein
MENTTEVLDSVQQTDATIGLSGNSITYLTETGKWVKFLSILGFIFLGLIVVVALLLGRIFASFNLGNAASPVPTMAISAVYLLMGLLHFFPIYYLFKFSSNVKKAFMQNDSATLEQAFESLKSHYKYVGVFMIVILGFYLLVGVIALIGFLA